uniref:Uncharacterized protein n=1 Tax=virus sp. ctiha2 TaxID=2827299 RepID=A0A8S5RH35_9VIRU|nr:MAG TPA: hypothetical protein [virus sp. ctiha2]DAE89652.1 MAG TPA: hypothetical protein [Bacteriophage sp.]DAX97716.1 MAG TPA: hypothetical protein [Caudoviricetes sp.]
MGRSQNLHHHFVMGSPSSTLFLTYIFVKIGFFFTQPISQ